MGRQAARTGGELVDKGKGLFLGHVYGSRLELRVFGVEDSKEAATMLRGKNGSNGERSERGRTWWTEKKARDKICVPQEFSRVVTGALLFWLAGWAAASCTHFQGLNLELQGPTA